MPTLGSPATSHLPANRGTQLAGGTANSEGYLTPADILSLMANQDFDNNPTLDIGAGAGSVRPLTGGLAVSEGITIGGTIAVVDPNNSNRDLVLAPKGTGRLKVGATPVPLLPTGPFTSGHLVVFANSSGDLADGGAPGASSGGQVTQYNTSGAIDPNDDVAELIGTAALNMSLANGTKDLHEITIVRPLASGGAHAVTANINGQSTQSVGFFGSPNGGESYKLQWSTGQTTWFHAGRDDPGLRASDLPPAGALADGDIWTPFQGNDVKTTGSALALYVNTRAVPPVGLGSSTTLSFAAHNGRTLYTTASFTLTIPSAASLGDFVACFYTMAGHTVTLSGTIYDLAGNTVTSIPPSREAKIATWGGSTYAIIEGVAGNLPVLQLTTISGQTPAGTSTASGTFANGQPASLAATNDGSALTITSVSIVLQGGTGATAYGTIGFNFTTPAAGTHAIVTTSTGTYGTSSNTYSLITSSSPLVAVSGVTPTGSGLLNAGATGTFSNGAPASLTAQMDGSSLSISSVSIVTTSGSGATAAGTWSFTFTNPAPGTHALIVAGTGTYAGTSSAYSYVTSTPTLTVSTITAPSPSTTFTVSGTYSSSNWNPSTLQYSTDSTNGSNGTWTGASGATITGGSFSFSLTGGLAAGTYTVWVRATANPQVFASSNSFTIVANASHFTGSPTSFTIGTGATQTLTFATVAGSWASGQTIGVAISGGGALSGPTNATLSGTGPYTLDPTDGNATNVTAVFTASGSPGTVTFTISGSGITADTTTLTGTITSSLASFPSLPSTGVDGETILVEARWDASHVTTSGSQVTAAADQSGNSNGAGLVSSVGASVGANIGSFGLPTVQWASASNASCDGLHVYGLNISTGFLNDAINLSARYTYFHVFRTKSSLPATQDEYMFMTGDFGASAQSYLVIDHTNGRLKWTDRTHPSGGVFVDITGATLAVNTTYRVIVRTRWAGVGNNVIVDAWVNGTKYSSLISSASVNGATNARSICIGQGVNDGTCNWGNWGNVNTLWAASGIIKGAVPDAYCAGAGSLDAWMQNWS